MAVVQHGFGAQGDGAREAERGEGNVHARVTLRGGGGLPARRGGGLEGVAARVCVGGRGSAWEGAGVVPGEPTGRGLSRQECQHTDRAGGSAWECRLGEA